MLPVQGSSQAGPIDQPIEETVEVPEQTPGEGSATEEPQPEQTFTRAQVEAMLADFEKKVDSRIQSQVAKSENRTTQRIQERLSSLDREVKAGTINLSEDQVREAKNNIIREEQMKEFEQGPQGKPSQSPEADFESQMMFVNTQIDEVVRGYGVEITPADKAEFKMIEDALRDPNGSLAKTIIAAGKAAAAKADRGKSFKGNAPARTVSDGQATSTSKPKPKTAEEKISAGLKKTEWRSDTPQK